MEALDYETIMLIINIFKTVFVPPENTLLFFVLLIYLSQGKTLKDKFFAWQRLSLCFVNANNRPKRFPQLICFPEFLACVIFLFPLMKFELISRGMFWNEKKKIQQKTFSFAKNLDYHNVLCFCSSLFWEKYCASSRYTEILECFCFTWW